MRNWRRFTTCASLLASFLAFLFCAFPTYATISFTLSSSQQSVDKDGEVPIQVTITGLTASSCTTCYLQAAFTKTTDNPRYLGFTQNGSGTWYQYTSTPSIDTITTTFFSFTPNSGSWSGTLKSKVNLADSDYKGGGTYYIRAARYTGKSSDGTWDTMTSPPSIVINDPTPTPTPSPTSTPVPTLTPTKTPTSSPTISPSPTPKPTVSPSIKLSMTVSPSATESSLPNDVLGASSEASTSEITPDSSPSGTQVLASHAVAIPVFLIGIGVVLMVVCGILIFRMRMKKDSDYD